MDDGDVGDWIRFRMNVDAECPTCEIFKNNKKVAHIDRLPFLDERNPDRLITDADGIYFCVIVDDRIDALLVEEILIQ